MSLLMAMWFASGMVMMYSGYPGLSTAERLAALPLLDGATLRLTLAEVLSAHRLAAPPREARLSMLGETPVYRLLDAEGHAVAYSAIDGSPIEADASTIRRAVAAFTGSRSSAACERRLTRPDQWTLSSSLAQHFPLHRCVLGDDDGTVLYVSRAAEVVHASTRRERSLAWLGAIPHWIYPAALRRQRELWRNLLIALASVGLVASASGLVVGLLRWRRRTSSSDTRPASPYRGNLRWHHYLGLGFGLTTFTWMLSGLFSMNPLDWSQGSTVPRQAELAMAGGELEPSLFRSLPANLPGTREIELVRFDGRPFYLHHSRPGSVVRTRADEPAGPTEPPLAAAELLAAISRGWPAATIGSSHLLTSYDAYYYDHRQQARPLPVLRVELADAGRTRIYLDPAAARAVASTDRTSRLERWLYHGLHSWDFGHFYATRPGWDLALLLLLAGGLLLSLTGVRAALGWLGRRRRRTLINP